MFAYCGNNPICYGDSDGYRQIPAARGFEEKNLDPEGHTFFPSALEIGPRSKLAREIDTLIFDFMKIGSIRDAIDVYNKFMKYEPIQDLSAVDQIYSGWDMMKEGAAIYSLPVITWVDEAVGMSKMLWGLGEIAQGIVELLDGGN